jgi:hypothetical protein
MSTAPFSLPSRRDGLVMVMRPLGIVTMVLVLYALTPVHAGSAAVAAILTSLASIGLLMWIGVRQARGALGPHPTCGGERGRDQRG